MSENHKNHNVVAIVRSVGERTEKTCYELLCQQIQSDKIVIINESPFSKAIQKTFEIGIDFNLDWTLCIDADVLLCQDAVKQLISVAENAQEDIFVVQAFVLCKFFGGIRPAGNHLYKTKHLKKALSYVADPSFIRPETETMNRMVAQGLSYIEKSFPIGLHDYEQFYKDIYRKSLVQAKKHSTLEKSLFVPFWSRMAKIDLDFQVALWGLEDGLNFNDQVRIDADQFTEMSTQRLLENNLVEKEPLENHFYTGSTVLREIQKYHLIPEFQQVYPYRAQSFADFKKSKLQKLIRQVKNRIKSFIS